VHKQKLNEAKMPLVSVHIITYNQKQFIHETLNSVLEQDYSNIEIVVADDGSTDGTAELILDFARQHPGKIVPLVGGPNLGITGNSNRGLLACTGKYIAFFGGDDVMLPNKIKVQVDYMESHPVCSICYHNLEVFDNESGNTLYLFNDVQKPYSGGVAGLIKYGCVNGGSSTMVRKEHIPSHGFDANIPIASDWLLWIETLITSKQEIHYINQVLGKYRRHDNNITKAKLGSYTQGVRDQLATCMKVLYLYPQYAGEVRYYLGSLLRGLRFTRNYQRCLISSLQFSTQIKTVVLLGLYWVTFGVVRR
jgi:glycosyltransferase involved in cell wall biosynthesis